MERLLDLASIEEGSLELRLFETKGHGGSLGFHPKAYLFLHEDPAQSVAFVGCSNLSRSAGHKSGLVVLATGLGKTWLAAFDSEAFAREERPGAVLGRCTGKAKNPRAHRRRRPARPLRPQPRQPR